MIFTTKIPLNCKPLKQLVTYMAERFTYYSENQWIEKIADSKVTIDGIVAKTADIASPGAVITYDAGEFSEPAANLDYRIIFEDEWFIGIDKPGNLLVHRAGRSFRNNLIYQLRFVHNPLFPDAHATHRLDRDTSGVLLVAKTDSSRSAMGRQFEIRAIDKEYLAIVKGIPPGTLKTICLPIGKDTNSEVSYRHWADPQGKDAVTEIISCTPVGKKYALLRLHPLTGRTHQIRIHCAATGYPIVGDKLYGMEESEYIRWRDNPEKFTDNMQFYRHALHCSSIGFTHPYTKEYCMIESGLPVDMSELIDKLRIE